MPLKTRDEHFKIRKIWTEVGALTRPVPTIYFSHETDSDRVYLIAELKVLSIVYGRIERRFDHTATSTPF